MMSGNPHGVRQKEHDAPILAENSFVEHLPYQTGAFLSLRNRKAALDGLLNGWITYDDTETVYGPKFP